MTRTAPEPLADHHILDAFDSGNVSLDSWLMQRARTNQASGASRTFVVADEGAVVAYYSLATGSIAHNEAVGSFRRNLPDPTPVVILARLAVDRTLQGSGYGRGLVKDAGLRVTAAAEQVGIRGVVVHAIDDAARRFYLKVGFLPSPTSPMTLMIPLSMLRTSMQD